MDTQWFADGRRVMIDVDAVAQWLNVGRGVVYRLVSRGKLNAVKVGQRLRFDPVHVREFLKRNAVNNQPVRS